MAAATSGSEKARRLRPPTFKGRYVRDLLLVSRLDTWVGIKVARIFSIARVIKLGLHGAQGAVLRSW